MSKARPAERRVSRFASRQQPQPQQDPSKEEGRAQPSVRSWLAPGCETEAINENCSCSDRSIVSGIKQTNSARSLLAGVLRLGTLRADFTRFMDLVSDSVCHNGLLSHSEENLGEISAKCQHLFRFFSRTLVFRALEPDLSTGFQPDSRVPTLWS